MICYLGVEDMVDLIPLVYGFVGTIIGAILTYGYNEYRDKKKARQDYEKMMSFIYEEVVHNSFILAELRGKVKEDLEYHKEKRVITNPLRLPSNLFWDVVVHNSNRHFFKSKLALEIIGVYRVYNDLRDLINSRELYRQSNRYDVTNYYDVLGKYDGMILEWLDKLIPDYNKLVDDLTKELNVPVQAEHPLRNLTKESGSEQIINVPLNPPQMI